MTLAAVNLDGTEHPLRSPCKRCGGTDGVIRPKGGQDIVRCVTCDTYQYCAPKVETGREVRSVSTVHEAISTKLRARIILRDNGSCALCHATDKPLHVGHLVSVKKGLSQGLTEMQLNSDENLAAMCEECNLGLSSDPVPLWICISILRARMRNEGNDAIPEVKG